MSKCWIAAAALVSLALAGSAIRADSSDERAQRHLTSVFGFRVESPQTGQQEGVTVEEVTPNSPAERAGMRRGDVITRIGHRPVEDFRDLANAILRFQAGQQVSVRVDRDGQYRNLSVRLGNLRMPGADEDTRDSQNRYGRLRDEDSTGDRTFQRLLTRFRQLESRLEQMERQNQFGRGGRGSTDELERMQQRVERLEQRLQDSQRQNQYGRFPSSTTLGIQTREWHRPSDSRQGGSADEGMEVTAVDPNSPAAEAGLRRDDVITRVNDRNVSTRQELRQAWQRSSQEATLEVLRGGRQMELTVRRDDSSSNTAQSRRYQRLQERLERLENRIRDLEQNQ